MHIIGTIREFRTPNFRVVVDAVEDDSPDMSWDENGEAQAKIDDGTYILFCARARIFFKGAEIAADYLGGCIYTSLAAFMDHKECGRQNREYAARGDAGRCGSYFADMVRGVCDEARRHIGDMRKIKIRKG